MFVLDLKGKPLTPTTSCRARKLMRDNQAKPIWNKFGCFGIQMLVPTGTAKPKGVLGIDFGTKFEGYAVTVGKENTLAVMWKLPDKKQLVRKLEERRILRRARRQRNCRRRECRSDNRERVGFLAPAQRLIVNSRLKAMQELFACYPIDASSLEDVRFNHRDNRWGKNFSTVEIGKKVIKDFLQERSDLYQWGGYDTQSFREQFGYHKSSSKSAEIFDAHCSDALALAVSVGAKEHIERGRFIVVDDTYRPKRRKLHDTQPAKGGIRDKYSTGNFKGIRKGTICNFGQIVGGTKESAFVRGWDNVRFGRAVRKFDWLSHRFKTNGVTAHSSQN